MMKQAIFFILLLLLESCDFHSENNNEKHLKELDTIQTVKPNKIAKEYDYFPWLLGKWKRVNSKGNNQTFEEWCMEDNTTYLGLGYTLKGTDTVFYEKMKLYKSNIYWLLNVNTKGDTSVTEFKLLEFGKKEFIAENKKNSFPTRIEYVQIEENKIKATVSNDKKKIIFEFEKLK